MLKKNDSASESRSIGRRAFLQGAAAIATTGLMGTEACTSTPMARSSSLSAREELIDVNVNLSRWPLRRLRYDDTPALVKKLQENGVVQAWAGSFDGMIHKDIGAVNARLTEECRRWGKAMILPFGSINPKFPDWEEELRRCAEEYKMQGIRLHPNYQGYKLDDPAFARLFRLAAERRLIVQIALLMEDERMMHPLLRVEPVEPAPLAELIQRTPGSRVVLLNALGKLTGESLTRLVSAGNLYVEIARLEGVGGVENLVSQIPAGRILFGSNAPLFYFESALLKLRESPLSPDQMRAITNGNARQLLMKT